MKISVGIDLGTTFSVAAYVDEFGKPQEIVDQQNRNAASIPSVVCYKNENNILVGDAALGEMALSPDKVIRSAKRFMNEKFDPPAGVPQDETPVKFQSKILGAIKSYVEDHSDGYEIEDAVITVPAYFDGIKINLTKEAAEIAGINVLGIINEPMAAAIYYCSEEEPQNQKFLVYDLGGGTFDVVVIEYRVSENGETEIVTLAQDGNHQLGGDDWDRRLMSFLLSEARKEEPSLPAKLTDLDSRDLQELWKKANAAKTTLSKKPSVDRTFEIDGNGFEVTIDRQDFESETKDLLDETGQRVDKVLQQCDLDGSDIDLVLLVGGSTLMPMVQEFLREKFGPEKVKVTDPNLAVAYGAAIYAQNLHKYIEIHSADNTSDTDGTSTTSTGGNLIDPVSLTPPPSIIFNAPRSIGVRSVLLGSDSASENTVITNLIFLGEQVKMGEFLESERTFASGQNGSFEVPFYSNHRSDKFNGVASDYSSSTEYMNANEDALIKVTFNPAAILVEDAYESDRTSDLLTYMASIYFDDDAIKENDEIKVTIMYSQDGAKAKVVHIPTGLEKELSLENANTSTSEEIQEEKDKLAKKNLERL